MEEILKQSIVKMKTKMKLIKFSILMTFLILVNIMCSNPSSITEDDYFAVYFLENDTLSFNKAKEIGLNNLELKNEPFISENDIDYYDSEEDLFILNKEFGTDEYYTKLETLYFRKCVTPIVLVIDSRRYFLGSIIGSISSLAYVGPRLDLIGTYDDTEIKFQFTFMSEDVHYKNHHKYKSMLYHFEK